MQLSFITSSEFHMSKIMARCNLTLEVFTYSYHTNAKDEIKSYIIISYSKIHIFSISWQDLLH